MELPLVLFLLPSPKYWDIGYIVVLPLLIKEIGGFLFHHYPDPREALGNGKFTMFLCTAEYGNFGSIEIITSHTWVIAK